MGTMRVMEGVEMEYSGEKWTGKRKRGSTGIARIGSGNWRNRRNMEEVVEDGKGVRYLNFEL